MSFVITIDGTPVEVELDSPILAFQLESPQVLVSPESVTIEVWSPSPKIVEVTWASPQIILSLSAVYLSATALQNVWGETPSGAIDGANLLYTSANLYSPGLLAVYLNGLRLRRSADYNETGSQSFQFLSAPLPGDSLSIDYIQP